MDFIDLAQRIALALAIGLLMGIERGWQEREGKDGSRAAGVRTFALIGLLGGICAALQPFVPGFLPVAFVAFAAALAVFEWREATLSGGTSATSMVAGLVAFGLGAYAVLGDMAIAGAAAIVATIVLAERVALHSFVAHLTWRELRAAMLLFAMTFVLLPLLPDRTIDPWAALNPRQLWLMMIVIATVSYVGYIGIRLIGDRAGLVVAGAAGGLVSSTAVTLSYAQLSSTHRKSATALAAGVTTSWAISALRMSAIAVAVAPGLLRPLGLVLGPAALTLMAAAAICYWRAGKTSEQSPLTLSDPFELREVLKFGVLLAVVLVITKLTGTPGAQYGLIVVAAISGLVDVDPVTLSAARMAGATITESYAAVAIAVAAGANLLCKIVVAGTLGSRELFLTVLAAGGLAAAAAAVMVGVLG